MAETLRITGGLINLTISNPITAALKALPKEVLAAIENVTKETSELLFTRIVDDTPRDRGSAGGAASKWTKSPPDASGTVTIENDAPHSRVLELGPYPVVATGKRKKRGGKKKKKKKRAGRKGREKRAKRERTGPGELRGNARLGGFPPGPRTQVAPGGSPVMKSNVSRQAPKGMVRQNLERIQDRYVFALEESIEQAFSDIAESA